MHTLTLRAFEAGDFDAWHALWRGYQSFYRVDIPESVSLATWSRLLDSSEPMHGTFAVAGSTPVGLVHYIEHRSCWTIGDYMYLQDLFVEAGHRKLGAGRALIQHVYAESAKRGCSRVHWLTHESNRDAMFLYDQVADRSGFLQYRRILAG